MKAIIVYNTYDLYSLFPEWGLPREIYKYIEYILEQITKKDLAVVFDGSRIKHLCYRSSIGEICWYAHCSIDAEIIQTLPFSFNSAQMHMEIYNAKDIELLQFSRERKYLYISSNVIYLKCKEWRALHDRINQFISKQRGWKNRTWNGNVKIRCQCGSLIYENGLKNHLVTKKHLKSKV